MPLSFEKPMGTKDVLPEKLQIIRRIITKSKSMLTNWGYEEIDTPILEYHQTVGLYSKIEEEKLIKFLDPTGKTVILRPDLTTPIARFVSSVYADLELPIRLMYTGNVYRNKGSQGIDEIKQLGVEIIGLKELEADAEVITLAVKIIKNCSSLPFKVSIGHTDFLKLLFAKAECNEEFQIQLFRYLQEHNYVSYKKLINESSITKQNKGYLLKVLKFRGNLQDIIEAKDWFRDEEWQNIFREISELWNILDQYEISDFVSFDLSLAGRQNYYTGLIYNVYCTGHPYPICSGGRYDKLLTSFGREAAATGFAVNIDDLFSVIVKENNTIFADNPILVIYVRKDRYKAIKKTEALRNAGKKVVMAEEKTVKENFKKRFSEIINI